MVAHCKQYSGSNHHHCSPGLMKLTLLSHSTLNLACLPFRLNTAVRMILFKGKSDHGIPLLKTFFKPKSLQTLHKLIILSLISSPSKLHNGLLASPETLALVSFPLCSFGTNFFVFGGYLHTSMTASRKKINMTITKSPTPKTTPHPDEGFFYCVVPWSNLNIGTQTKQDKSIQQDRNVCKAAQLWLLEYVQQLTD